MSPQTVIDIAAAIVIGSTALTLAATLVHFWKRYQIEWRDAKLHHAGSRQPSLDPERGLILPDREVDIPDTDLTAAGLDPDRPLPPPDNEADDPDVIEEEVHHG